MTAEPSLFERIRPHFKGSSADSAVHAARIQKICDDYEESQGGILRAASEACKKLHLRILELERNNKIMADRLIKLERQLPSEE